MIKGQTRQQFKEGYCKRMGMSIEEYDRYRITLPCKCDEGKEHWASVLKDWDVIETHFELYFPGEF